jgi:hypothetical protein
LDDQGCQALLIIKQQALPTLLAHPGYLAWFSRQARSTPQAGEGNQSD